MPVTPNFYNKEWCLNVPFPMEEWAVSCFYCADQNSVKENQLLFNEFGETSHIHFCKSQCS